MKTNTHICSYLSHFFLEWEIFQTKDIEKIKTHILCSIKFFRKPCCLWDNVGKRGTSRQPTDNMIRRIRFACCIIKAADTHLEHVMILLFQATIVPRMCFIVKLIVHILSTWWLQYSLAQSDCLAADRQGQWDTGLTLTPSVITNSNYVIMVSDWNCLKYFFLFFIP
jgi:hypothetical protein